MMKSFLEESPLHVVAGSPVFERLNLADKLSHIVELAVDRDVAHIGDGIDPRVSRARGGKPPGR